MAIDDIFVVLHCNRDAKSGRRSEICEQDDRGSDSQSNSCLVLPEIGSASSMYLGSLVEPRRGTTSSAPQLRQAFIFAIRPFG
jgi:hypothetical protein